MAAGLAVCGCAPDDDAIGGRRIVLGGSAEAGLELAKQYGCAACHILPQINDPQGRVGPSLVDFADQTFVAGRVPNQGDNLIRWIRNPGTIDPETAMPDLGISDAEARDIAAYLYEAGS